MTDRYTISRLFPEGIYRIPEKKVQPEVSTPVAPAEPQHIPLAVKGDNRQEVVILVDYHGVPVIPPADEAFLMKMMGAVGLTLRDIAVINIHTLNDESQLATFPCRKALLFGTTLSWHTGELYVLSRQQDREVICSDPLYEIENDDQRKRLLWNSLKQMFSV